MDLKFLSAPKKVDGILCLLVTIGIIVAGLWPFDFWPENKVKWLKDRNGVHFYGQGIIYSTFPLFQPSNIPNKSIALELWLQSDVEPDSYLPRILSLYDGKESEDFFVGQWKSHLILRGKVLSAKSGRVYREVGVRNALAKGQSRFIAITSDEKGTSIYVDGKLEKTYSDFSFIPKDRMTSGQIILGNSPRGKDYWTGYIFGLAIYQISLTTEEVSEHFQQGMNGKTPSLLEGKEQVTVYRFHERAGTRIHDQTNRHDLLMPPRFHALQKEILVPPWQDFQFNLSYFEDIGVNVLGFIPFGFLILAYLSNKKITSTGCLYIITIFFGSLLSLAIELLQVYLPTRSSQLMDVFTNILGTFLGTILFHFYQGREKSLLMR
jgi:hypothetical protein